MFMVHRLIMIDIALGYTLSRFKGQFVGHHTTPACLLAEQWLRCVANLSIVVRTDNCTLDDIFLWKGVLGTIERARGMRWA